MVVAYASVAPDYIVCPRQGYLNSKQQKEMTLAQAICVILQKGKRKCDGSAKTKEKRISTSIWRVSQANLKLVEMLSTPCGIALKTLKKHKFDGTIRGKRKNVREINWKDKGKVSGDYEKCQIELKNMYQSPKSCEMATSAKSGQPNRGSTYLLNIRDQSTLYLIDMDPNVQVREEWHAKELKLEVI